MRPGLTLIRTWKVKARVPHASMPISESSVDASFSVVN